MLLLCLTGEIISKVICAWTARSEASLWALQKCSGPKSTSLGTPYTWWEALS